MNYGDLANLLIDTVRRFASGAACAVFLKERWEAPITVGLVADLGEAILADAELPSRWPFLADEAVPFIRAKKGEWALIAGRQIHLDRHMNNVPEGANTLTPATLDALIVSFANYIAAPLDLALYTSDLRRAS